MEDVAGVEVSWQLAPILSTLRSGPLPTHIQEFELTASSTPGSLRLPLEIFMNHSEIQEHSPTCSTYFRWEKTCPKASPGCDSTIVWGPVWNVVTLFAVNRHLDWPDRVTNPTFRSCSFEPMAPAVCHFPIADVVWM